MSDEGFMRLSMSRDRPDDRGHWLTTPSRVCFPVPSDEDMQRIDRLRNMRSSLFTVTELGLLLHANLYNEDTLRRLKELEDRVMNQSNVVTESLKRAADQWKQDTQRRLNEVLERFGEEASDDA